MAAITILRPGMLTTIQDLGRWGNQAHGVPVAGPMDPYSHMVANQLVGNQASGAALEVTMLGPELQSNADLTCAVTGATFTLTAGDSRVAMNTPFTLRAGARLRFGDRLEGARATLAIRGGIDVPPVLGSRSTSLIARMGPLGGRALVAGDVLPIGAAHVSSSIDPTLPALPALPLPHRGAQLRVMAGPHQDKFTSSTYQVLFDSRYLVTPSSNRMGYRLEGPALRHSVSADILSDATPVGSIQVPSSGQPILLMADRQTTGGYARIGTVITADLPIAGQLAPGDWIEFRPISHRRALEALHARYDALRRPHR